MARPPAGLVDWYRIEIDDAIVTVFADEFISRCFDRTFNPELEASNQWCGMFSRNPTSGDIVDAFEILRNSEGLRTSGLDLQLDWRFDLGPGELGVNWLVAYLDSFEQLEASGIPPWSWLERRDVRGFPRAFTPEWKWSFSLSYAWQALTLDARWRYIDGMKDADTAIEPEFRIPHYDYIRSRCVL